MHFDSRYLDFINACILKIGNILLNARNGTEFQFLSIVFQSMSCADPECFVRGDPNLITFFCFLVDEGIEDPNTTINGPSSACHTPPFGFVAL